MRWHGAAWAQAGAAGSRAVVISPSVHCPLRASWGVGRLPDIDVTWAGCILRVSDPVQKDGLPPSGPQGPFCSDSDFASAILAKLFWTRPSESVSSKGMSRGVWHPPSGSCSVQIPGWDRRGQSHGQWHRVPSSAQAGPATHARGVRTGESWRCPGAGGLCPPPALNTQSLSRALQGAGGGGAPEEVPRASVQAARSSPLCLLRAPPSLQSPPRLRPLCVT